jgi:hypothetical protein
MAIEQFASQHCICEHAGAEGKLMLRGSSKAIRNIARRHYRPGIRETIGIIFYRLG